MTHASTIVGIQPAGRNLAATSKDCLVGWELKVFYSGGYLVKTNVWIPKGLAPMEDWQRVQRSPHVHHAYLYRRGKKLYAYDGRATSPLETTQTFSLLAQARGGRA